VTAQFRHPLFIEASHQDLGEIGLALNGKQAFGVLKLVNCSNGVVVRRGRFRWFKVGGAGADGGRAMEDFGRQW
jgi:hypothetical protein